MAARLWKRGRWPLVAVLLAALAGCGFSADYAGTGYRCGVDDTCPSGFTCTAGVCVAAGGQPDGGDGTRLQTWTSDTADDFAADGYAISDARIAPRGAIEPAAYDTGGVLEHGGVGAMTDSSWTWDQVVALPPSPGASILRTPDVTWDDVPPGVGLTVADDWTLRFEGELWLDPGDWTFFYYADDHGFLELAAPGGAFQRVVSADWPDESQGTFHADAAGWYPVRWALSDTGEEGVATLRYQGPGVSQPVVVPRHRLRCRVDQLDGLVMDGFDGEVLAGTRGTTIDATAPAGVDWIDGAPGDLGLSGADHFSVRWAGQVRLDVAGTYAFRYATEDGQRLWIDGLEVANAWDQTSHDRVTPPLALDAGWHDLVVDQTEHTGTASAILTVEDGPDLVGAQLPVDHLRPVEGRGERYEHASDTNRVSIPDATSPDPADWGTVDVALPIAAPAGVATYGIDVAFTYDHTWRGDLQVSLVAPSGTSVVLRPWSNDDASGTFTDRYYTTALDGEAVDGTWKVRFADTVPQDTGHARAVHVTIHTQGAGEPPIATDAVYLSPVHDLGGTATLGAVHWTEEVPTGTAVAVHVRTGATADACAAAAWSAPLTDPAGSTATVPAGGFAQYQVELTSSGDVVPAVESISIDYALPAP
jgi:subtilisin-like proprotein convertase family protein